MAESRLSSAVTTDVRTTTNGSTYGRRTRMSPSSGFEVETGLINNLAAIGMNLFVMVVLDLIWLRIIAWPLYAQGLAHLLADRPNLPAVALFYAVYALALLIFAVAPPGLKRNPPGVRRAAISGALFGLFAHATYDLANLAKLHEWPALLSAIDIAWGAALSDVCAATGKRAWDHFATP